MRFCKKDPNPTCDACYLNSLDDIESIGHSTLIMLFDTTSLQYLSLNNVYWRVWFYGIPPIYLKNT